VAQSINTTPKNYIPMVEGCANRLERGVEAWIDLEECQRSRSAADSLRSAIYVMVLGNCGAISCSLPLD